MRIFEICTRHIFTVPSEATVEEAARRMRRFHVGALVVVAENDTAQRPIGVLTDRDIVVQVVAAQIGCATLNVRDVMSGAPAHCAESDDVVSALQVMRNRGTRRLVVVDENGSATGFVSADDIIGAVAREIGDLAQTLVREQVHEMQKRPD